MAENDTITTPAPDAPDAPEQKPKVTPVVSIPDHFYIHPTAIQFTLNALGDPDRISVTVGDDAKVSVYVPPQEGYAEIYYIGFSSANGYRQWTLTAYATHFLDPEGVARYCYLALERFGTKALVVFPKVRLDLAGYAVNDDASEYLEQVPPARGSYYYILLGQLTASNGGLRMREWATSSQPITGTLGTPRYNEEHLGEDGKPGANGNITEYVYKRQAASSPLPEITAEPVQQDGYIPEGWTDHPSGVTAELRYEFVAMREKRGGAGGEGGTWSAWSVSPWSIYGEKGQDGDGMEYVFCCTQEEVVPSIIYDVNSPAYQQPEFLPVDANGQPWLDDSVTPDETNRFVWASKRRKVNGRWRGFGNVFIWGRFVEDGAPGMDGERIEEVFKLSATADYPTIDEGPVQEDEYIPEGWTRQASGITQQMRYEFKATRRKTGSYGGEGGTWSAFTITLVSVWGEKGEDGNGVEYVHLRTATDIKPQCTFHENSAEYQQDEYLPTNGVGGESWTDDFVGPTRELPWAWGAKRKKLNGHWGAFGEVELWSRYAEDGKPGASPIVADLDNEMDSIVTGTDGVVTKNVRLYTTYNMYMGSQQLELDSLTATSDVEGVSPSCDSSNGVVTVTIGQAFVADKAIVSITASPKGMPDVSRMLQFTINKLRMGHDGRTPVVYHLSPSVTAIKVSKEGDYSPVVVKCNIKKFDGTNEYKVASLPEGWRVDVSKDGAPETGYTLDANIDVTDVSDNITFRLLYSTTLVDAETVPVILDGQDGEDGEPGMDGERTEEVFKLSATADYPTIDEGPVQEDEYIPEGWTRQASGITQQMRYEFKATRRKTGSYGGEGGTWSAFTITLVSVWGEKGEDGNGVEYVHFRTATDTKPQCTFSGNPAEYQQDEYLPTNGVGGESWTDDFVGPTRELPWAWGAKRKKLNGHWGAFGEVELWSRYAEDGKPGASPIVADLDNEMDSIVTGTDGVVTKNVRLYTTYNMYMGSQRLELDSLTATSDVEGVSPSCDSSNGVVTVTIGQAFVADKAIVSITASPKGMPDISRTLRFTINKLRMGHDGRTPVVYRLSPSVTAIKVSKEGDYSPVAVKCNIKKFDGTNEYKVASLPEGWRVDVSKDGAPETGYTLDANIDVTDVSDNITFRLLYSTTLVDAETVPVILDGQDGEDGEPGQDAILYSLMPSATVIKKNSDKSCTPDILSCAVNRSVGSFVQQDIALPEGWSMRLWIDNNASVYNPKSETNKNIASSLAKTRFKFDLRDADQNTIATTDIPIVNDGQPGEDGPYWEPTISDNKITFKKYRGDGTADTDAPILVTPDLKGDDGLPVGENLQSGNLYPASNYQRHSTGSSTFSDGIYQFVNTSTRSIWEFMPYIYLSMGEKYTISLEYKTEGTSSGNHGVSIYQMGVYEAGTTMPASAEWRRIEFSYVAKMTAQSWLELSCHNPATSGEITKLWVRRIKVEKGAKATAFCYSLEEQQPIKLRPKWEGTKLSFEQVMPGQAYDATNPVDLKGNKGEDGKTWKPNITETGRIYFTRDGEAPTYTTPDNSFNIKGADGKTPTITTSKSDGTLSIKVDGTKVGEVADGYTPIKGKDYFDGLSVRANLQNGNLRPAYLYDMYYAPNRATFNEGVYSFVNEKVETSNDNEQAKDPTDKTIWDYMPYVQVEQGKTYTVSFEYKTEGTINRAHPAHICSMSGDVKDGQSVVSLSLTTSATWKRISAQFTASKSTRIYLEYGCRPSSVNNNPSKLWVRHFKIEEGAEPTAFCYSDSESQGLSTGVNLQDGNMYAAKVYEPKWNGESVFSEGEYLFTNTHNSNDKTPNMYARMPLIMLEEQRYYAISFEYKTEGKSTERHYAGFYASDDYSKGIVSMYLDPSTTWRRVSMACKTTSAVNHYLQFCCRASSETDKPTKLWYRKVKVEEGCATAFCYSLRDSDVKRVLENVEQITIAGVTIAKDTEGNGYIKILKKKQNEDDPDEGALLSHNNLYLKSVPTGPSTAGNIKEVSISPGAICGATMNAQCDNTTSEQSLLGDEESDDRLKVRKGEVSLTAEQVADAPVFDFAWKPEILPHSDETLHTGTSAQYWQSLLPNVVHEGADGYLRLEYAKAAMVAVVSLAKEVQRLQQEVKALREQLRQ